MGSRTERNWRRGGDGAEWTWEMQPEKEGCERRSALVEIRRGGRRCAAGAGGGDEWVGREKSSRGRNPIRQPCDLYRSMRGEASSIFHGFSAFLYVVCLLCSSGQRPMVVPIQYKLWQTMCSLFNQVCAFLNFYWFIVFQAASTHWYRSYLAIGISDGFCKLLLTFSFILSQSNFFSNPKLSIIWKN
jgi:hypothetical protein